MFSYMTCGLLETFCPKYIDIRIQSVFSPQRVSQKMQSAMKHWLKIEIYDFIQYNCSTDKLFFMIWGILNALFPNTQIYYSKQISMIQGVLKYGKYYENRLKIEIYEFKQKSCFPENVFFYEVGPFGNQIHRILTQSVFSPYKLS